MSAESDPTEQFVIDAGVEVDPPPLEVAEPAEYALLPAFLKQSDAVLHRKFMELGWQQGERLYSQHVKANDESENPEAGKLVRMSGEVVSQRNRYLDLSPFTTNRVCLKVPEGQDDYINASPIKLTLSDDVTQKDFIATQGPKGDSFSHFWRMVSNEAGNPAVIVMLTQTHEAGREKCYPYYPLDLDSPLIDLNTDDEFGDGITGKLTLKSIVEDEEILSTVRELELETSDGTSKTVWHYLFTGWPDFQIPEGDHRHALLRLIQATQIKNSDPTSRRIVHCSAGVGRSGTFISLDYLLAELDAGALDEIPEDADPIYDLVSDLREQRMMMVEAEMQFFFIYRFLQELWLERFRARSS